MNEQALTYAEIDLPKCGLTYGERPCEARLSPLWGEPGAVLFDHTNDYLTRGAGLTGAADSKLFTFSGWIRLDGTLGGRIIASEPVGTNRVVLSATVNHFAGVFYNSAGTTIANFDTDAAIPTDGKWHHLLASFDLTNVAKRHVYVDDVAVATSWPVYTNDTIDFTKTDWGVGAYHDGTSKFGGRMAELWFAPGVYIDFSVAANRRKFIDASGLPVDVGATGSTPTGTAPIVYLSNRDGRFETNKGTGGGFTIQGDLESAEFGTGDEKCFNTRATCQDLVHYDSTPRPTDTGTVVDTQTSDPNSLTVTLSDRPLGAVAEAGHTRTIVMEFAASSNGGAAVALSSATINGYPCLIRKTQAVGDMIVGFIETLTDPGGTEGDWVLTFTGGTIRRIRTRVFSLLDVVYNNSYSSIAEPVASANTGFFEESQLLLGIVASREMSTTVWAGVTESNDTSETGGMAWSSAELRRTSIGGVDPWTVSATQSYPAFSTPTFVKSTDHSGTSSVNVSDSGLAVNDVVFFAVETDDDTTYDTPVGLAVVDTETRDDPNGTKLTVFWQRLGGTSFNHNFVATANQDHFHVRTMVIRGCVASGNPWTAVAKGNNSGTSISVPGLTTTINNTLVLDFVSTAVNDDSFSSWANADLASVTERYEGATSSGNDGGSAGATGEKVTAGAVGATTVTAAQNTSHAYMKIAVVPTLNTGSVMTMAVAKYDWVPGQELTEETIRFGMDTGFNPKDIQCIPCLDGVNHNPTVISLGENLGTRESVTLRLNDVKHPDIGGPFDKYWDERGYDPYEVGTLFGRMRSRQPYLNGHDLRWYEGFVGQALEDMVVRSYLVESFSGPGPNGEVIIVARDPLKLADSDKALAPLPADGYLASDITDVATSASLSPPGIGDLQYEPSGLLTLAGNEIVSYTRTGDSLTIVRGQEGTPASAHEEEDRVQPALVYDGVDPADIIYDLLVNFAGVDPNWIDLPDWQAETGAYLRRVYSAVIGEPTPVRKLIAELIQQCGLAMWWDSRNSKIRMIVLREVPADATVIDAEVRLEESPNVIDQPDKRVSQVLVYYGIKDPLKGQTDPNNFRQIARSIDAESELNYESSSIKSIFARWIPPFARTTAFRVGDIVLGRFVDAPRKFTFPLFRIGPVTPQLGGAYRLKARNLQLANGSLDSVPVQVTSIRVQRDRYLVEAEEMRFLSLDEQDLANRVIVISGTNFNLNLKSIHDDIYPPLRDGDTITFRFDATSATGSNDASIPSVTVDTWPAGFVPHIDVFGLIQGRGGAGGKGANDGGNAGSGGKNGQKGGTALYTRTAITLTDTTGKLWAGGGGGAGGSCADFNDHRGGGGGGGAGTIGGAGGIGPGNGEDGDPGTASAGGQGGRSYTSSTFWTGPSLKDNIRGGDGGDVGAAGDNDVGSYDVPGGSPGAAGNAIDGISFVTTVGAAGSRLGLQVN